MTWRKGHSVRGSVVALTTLIVLSALVLLPRSVRELVTGEERVLFTVWGMPFEDRLFEDVYARGFEAVEPEVRVDYRRYAEVQPKYTAWHSRGVGAEVMRIGITDYHRMVERGMLLRLDDLIADPDTGLDPAVLDAIPPQLLDTLRVDGSLYALPQDMAQYGLYYNRAIFDTYNAAHPDDPIGYPDESWDWQTLREVAKKLTVRERDTSGTERVVTYGLDFEIWQWPFMNFFVQAGGELWTDDGLTTLIDSEAGVEAVDFLQTLVFEDRSFVPSFGEQQGAGPNARFATGRSAMLYAGSWMVPYFQLNAPDLDFAVAPSPRGRVPAVCSGSCVWGISVHAPHKNVAWRMLRWLVEPAQAIEYWDTLRVAPPANTDVIASAGFRETRGIADPDRPGAYLVAPMPEEKYDAYAAWLSYGTTPRTESGEAPAFIPASLYQRELEQEIFAMLQTILRDPAEPSAEDALRRVADTVHGFIDRDRSSKGLLAVDRTHQPQ